MTAEELIHEIQSGNISLEDLSEAAMEADMANKISEIHKNNVCQLKDGRYKTYIFHDGKKKQFVAPTKAKLYKKLCDWYGIEADDTVEDVYNAWIEYKEKNTQTKYETIRRNKYFYKKFFAGTDIIKKKITELKYTDWQKFFDGVAKQDVTKKVMSSVKSIANGIYTYAYDHLEYDIINYIDRIDFKKYRYKVQDDALDDVYKQDETIKLIGFILSLEALDTYDLAILLLTQVCARIGEIRGLRWSDVENGYINIRGQFLDAEGYVPYTKGRTSQGIRSFKQTQIAQFVLSRLKQMNGDMEYIFMYDYHTILPNVCNNRLRRYCKELGIPYHSTHKFRFYTASLMAEQGFSMLELRDTLGHTTTQMSEHYIRRISDNKRLDKVSDVLEQNSLVILGDLMNFPMGKAAQTP